MDDSVSGWEFALQLVFRERLTHEEYSWCKLFAHALDWLVQEKAILVVYTHVKWEECRAKQQGFLRSGFQQLAHPPSATPRLVVPALFLTPCVSIIFTCMSSFKALKKQATWRWSCCLPPTSERERWRESKNERTSRVFEPVFKLRMVRGNGRQLAECC